MPVACHDGPTRCCLTAAAASVASPSSLPPHPLLPHRCCCSLCLTAPPAAPWLLQGELAAIQKEKERLDTTTIDEELAANPELAKVGGAGSLPVATPPARVVPLASVRPSEWARSALLLLLLLLLLLGCWSICCARMRVPCWHACRRAVQGTSWRCLAMPRSTTQPPAHQCFARSFFRALLQEIDEELQKNHFMVV